MADDVVYHPSAKLRKKIDSLAAPDTSDLIEILIEHYDSGCDRTHLGNVVRGGYFSSHAKGHDILTLLDWASDKSLHLGGADGGELVTDSDDEAAPTGDDGQTRDLDERFAGIAKAAFAAAEASSKMEEAFRRLGEFERYGNFPPSWGLETATWSRIFGDHDPVPTIDFYIANFFDDAIKVPDFGHISLHDWDIIIWRSIINALSDIPWKIRINEPELIKEQKARALHAALGLPDEIRPTLSIADPDLCEIIELSPGWMASRLIGWWTSHDIEWIRRNEDSVDGLIPDQVDLVYRIMVKHLVDWRKLGEDELQEQFSVTPEDIETLPDYFPTFSRAYERIVEAFWGALDDWGGDTWYRTNLTKAVYLARNRVFRNRFPFPSNSVLVLAELNQEEGYWLAHFCAARENPRQIFKYLSFPTERIDNDPWIARLQLVGKARERLGAYEHALEEMIRDSNLELARAWWAFFMASQSQMFAGFGLGSRESRRIIDLAESLLPDEGLERAFEFVRAMAADAEDPLDERIVLDLLPRRSTRARIVELSPRSGDDFLGQRITREVWERLHPETCQDIRDAESLWERSFREMGAGRIDWGGLGIIYARAIEREMKAHITPLLRPLREAGVIRDRKGDTIGSIVKACEDARTCLGNQTGGDLSRISRVISGLDDAFKGELKVITEIRNRAAHGDNADPVVHVEFVKLRAAILERGAFRTIIECSQLVP